MCHAGNGSKSGQRLTGAVRFFCFALLLLPVVAGAQSLQLNDIAQLARGGATQLALSLIDQGQPELAEDTNGWMRWERMRVRILEQRGQWALLEQRLANTTAELPPAFQRWATTRRARALILGGSPQQGRVLLRQLLWQSGVEDSSQLAQWRQLVMQSYLHEGRVDDAYVAMLRYHQDYGEGGESELLMRARILLASDNPSEAERILDSLEGPTAELLKALAALRGGKTVEKILQARRKADIEAYSPLQQYLHYGLMAEAAERAGEHAFAIIALEQWFRLATPHDEWRELFDFPAEKLWQAYRGYAIRIGNSEQLLLGNDAAWVKLADETERRYPVRKRSLYALVAIEGYDRKAREQAGIELAKSLMEQENGVAVVQHLFLDSRFGPDNPLPAGVAYLLVDEAIRNGDLPLASRLLQQLPEPPGDTERVPWQMRRVKVFILAGEYVPAIRLLEQLIADSSSFSQQQRDLLLQLLFDLQTVDEHEQAYRLLQQLYRHTPEQKPRRELLFWMADSQVAREQYADAARLYLYSATLGDANSMDPWAQTARYKAAKTLATAGMLDDAAFIYGQLLKVTEKPERRAVLRHELEQVRMRQAADEKR